MRILISFILGALGAIIMYNVKANFSFKVTMIVFIVLVIFVFIFDAFWKRYKTKREQE